MRDSSLSAATQAVIAAEVGHLDLALDYTGEAALMDLRDLEHNTRDGLHMASLAGAFLSIGDIHTFTEGMTNGVGYLAIVAVIFGNWKIMRTLFATLLFGAATALQFQLPALGVDVNAEPGPGGTVLRATFSIDLKALPLLDRGNVRADCQPLIRRIRWKPQTSGRAKPT